MKTFTKRSPNELCEVYLQWNQNHSIDCFHLTSFCKILPTTIDKFHQYFMQGMSPSEAFHFHEAQMIKNSETQVLLADRKYCPSLKDVSNMYDKWRFEVKGPTNGEEMFSHLEKLVEQYNKKMKVLMAGVSFRNTRVMKKMSCLSYCLFVHL